MPRSAKKSAPEKPKTPDQELAHHLEKAESHLIDAVNLFQNPRMKRRDGFLDKLTRAQESVTTLYGEELVRIRGPQRPPRRRKLR